MKRYNLKYDKNHKVYNKTNVNYLIIRMLKIYQHKKVNKYFDLKF